VRRPAGDDGQEILARTAAMMPATCPCGQRLQTSKDATETLLTCPDCGWALIVSAQDAARSGPGIELGNDSLAGRSTIERDLGTGAPAPKSIPRLGAAAAALGLIAGAAHGASCSAWGAAIAGLGLTLAGAGLLIAHLRGHAAGIPLLSLLYCGTVAALALTAAPAGAPRPEESAADLGPRPILAGRRPRREDVQIQLVSAEMTRPLVRELYFNEPTRWKEPGLLLTLEICNVGTSREVAYEPHHCRVVDNLGSTFEEVNMGTASLADRPRGDHRLKPGQSLRDLLFFDPPPDRIAYLDLVIPGAILGQTDPFQLRIPADRIRR
jgi:predicted RNA-binding Zn-ribbon protein involved in translation (DUF1610 family)